MRNKLNIFLFSLLLILTVPCLVQAQNTACLEFLEIADGTFYTDDVGAAPPALITVEDFVDTRLHVFLNANGSTEFSYIAFAGEEEEAREILLQGAALEFDFTKIPNNDFASSVCFALSGGAGINLGVNGTTRYFSSVAALASNPEPWPGISEVFVTEMGTSNTWMICIEGEVEAVVIGHEEGWLSNLCFATPNDLPDCILFDLTAQQIGCDASGQSNVAFNFQAIGTDDLGYDVWLDDEYFGFFSYDNDNPVLENVRDWVEGDELTIRLCENDNADCCVEITIPWQDCNEGCIEFGLFEQDQYGADLFSSIYYESYTDLSLDSFYFGDEHFLEALLIVDNPASNFFAAASPPFIHLINIGTHFDFADYEAPVSRVSIDYFLGGAIEPGLETFWSVNVNDAFPLSFDDFTAGVYILAHSVTMEVIPDPVVDGQGQLIFSGAIESLYIGSNHLYLDNLCIEPSCGLPTVELYQQPCNDDGGYQILADISEIYIEDDTQYELFINGQGVDTLEAEDYPFVIGPFTFTDPFLITLQDLNIEVGEDSCFFFQQFVPTLCDEYCQNFSIDILNISCVAPYLTEIEFSVNSNIPGGFFRVRRNGITLEEYAYGQDTYTLQLLSDADIIVLEFSDDQQDCSFSLDLTNPCIPDDCVIADLTAVSTDCVDGYYSVIVDFEYSGQFDEGFTYAIGGIDGEFDLADLPLEVGPIPYNPGTAPGLVVWGPGLACIEDVAVTPSCAVGCEDFFVEVVDIMCQGDFETILLFEIGPQVPDGTFRILRNGQLLEEYVYGDSIYQVHVFSDSPGYELEFIDDQTGCVQHLTLTNPCIQACGIFDLTATASDCENGAFYVTFDFGYEGNQVDGFFYAIDGSTDDFNLDDLPLTIGPFDNSQGTIFDLIVYQPIGGCEAVTTIFQDCGTDCEEFSVDVFQIDCPEPFLSLIQFTIEPQIDDGTFRVFRNGVLLEEYVYGQTAYTLELTSDAPSYVFDFVDDQTGCEQTVELDNPCIFAGCQFSDVFAEAHPCDDGQFLIDFEFESIQVSGSFFAFVNGNLFGPFVYGQSFYTVGPFAAGQNSYDLTLIDSAEPSCFGFYSLAAPICDDECHILEVTAMPTDCNDDGAFFVAIDFNHFNTGNGFTVVGNGNNYGTFGYNELPLTLGPFVADGETEYEFGIIDLTNPDCFNFTSIPPQNCFECSFSALEYTVDCFSDEFIGVLNVFADHDFADDEPFVLYLGPIFLGEFQFSDLPLSLERSLDLLSEGETLRIEFPGTDCELVVPYELPCCHLDFGDDFVSANDCEDNGEFYALLELPDTPFNGSDSVEVTYGPTGSGAIASMTFAYSDFPIELGPLPGNGETDYYFLLTDQTQDCSATATLEAVSCNNGGCVEFSGLTEHFYGPNTGYEDGDLIDEEDGVLISYEDHPESDCACYVFGFEAGGVPAFIQAAGLTAMTDRSGIGLHFGELDGVEDVSIDYYFAGQSLSVSINGSDLIEIDFAPNTDIEILPGIIFSYSAEASGDGTTGTITLSSGLIEKLELYSIGTAVFDNVCHGGAEPQDPFSDDEVWPGDVNTNNVADIYDLLNIGVAFAAEGPGRTNASPDWEAQTASDWEEVFADGVNYKHADTDGNGTVNENDVAILEMNYGLEHGAVETFTSPPATDADPPIFLDMSDIGSPQIGSQIVIPIVLGTEAQPVEDIYGIAFQLNFEATAFQLSSLSLEIPTSWLGEPGVNLLHIDQANPAENVWDISLVRNDHNNVSGYGPVAYLRGIIDDIAGITSEEVDFDFSEILAIESHGHPMPINRISSSFLVAVEPIKGNEKIRFMPNPSTGDLYVRGPVEEIPPFVKVYAADSRFLGNFAIESGYIDLNRLPSGVYFLELDRGILRTMERVVIAR